jgi:succinate dehydrogenase/fumarate reductase flavoprotein subunit
MKYQVIDTDVLVVGAGGAGCRAAIGASNYNVQVTVITKDILGKAHTVMAEGGVNAALGNSDPGDNWEIHGYDTVSGGAYLNDQELVEVLVKNAPERILELEEFGALFSRTPDGKIAQRPFGKQSFPRSCYAADRSGHEIMVTLVDEMRRRDIEVHDEVYATSLLRDGPAVAGVTALDIRRGEFRVYRAKATVMASGGAGRIYEITTNAQADVGSGYAMAYRAGVEQVDMEQYQFHPTGVAFPESARGMLVTEGVRGEGGILLNKFGERFMKRYHPDTMELAGRDQVSRAIATEILEGRGTEHGAVYLDVSFLPSSLIEEALPTMFHDFMDFGVDIRNEPMEVTPTAHHYMGGIRINTRCETNLRGLYAAGEVTGGVHGGNRLGGNALADIVVFGAIAGESAAAYALSSDMPKLDRRQIEGEYERVFAPLERKDGVRQSQLKRRLAKLMWDKVGIFRNGRDMKSALDEIVLMRTKDEPRIYTDNKSTRYNMELVGALEVSDMLLVSEILTRSALMREDSRGAHYRTDFPKPNHQKWFVNICVRRDGNEMRLYTKPVLITRWKPPWMEKS